MILKRLGLSWGAAYEEALPTEVIHEEDSFIFYLDEAGTMIIEVPPGSNITFSEGKFNIEVAS